LQLSFVMVEVATTLVIARSRLSAMRRAPSPKCASAGGAQTSGSVFARRSTIASSKPVGVTISVLIRSRRCAADRVAAINQHLELVFDIPI